MTKGLHQNTLRTSGASLADARVAVVMVHGRGATAESILSLARYFPQEDVAYLAPQADGNTWYPLSFLSPLSQNEPHLGAAVDAVDRAGTAAHEAGIPWERILVLGFSQGACLALEYGARNARRYGGIIGLSGGLIGNGQIDGTAAPEDKSFVYPGSLDGTPVFVGCSDQDPHIPVRRVHQTAEVLRALGADVTERIYPGMGHTVNEEEIDLARELIQKAL